MKNDEIIYTGKCTFWLFFILGNICLFGYLITRNDSFAAGGYMLLIFGTIINLFLVIGLLIYGIASRSKFNACLKAIGLLMINIPIAFIYALIGLNLN